MNQPSKLSPVTLGAAAGDGDGLCGVANLASDRWLVVWLNPAGRIVQSTGGTAGGSWSEASPAFSEPFAGGFSDLFLTGDRESGWRLVVRAQVGAQPTWYAWHRCFELDKWVPEIDYQHVDQPAEPEPPGGVLAWTQHAGVKVAVRSGCRMVGVPPRFPSAGLVVSVEERDGWRNVGYADEAPDAPIDAAALATNEGDVLAAYVIADDAGRRVCRVVQSPLKPELNRPSVWREMPRYPQTPGMAGLLAGSHAGVLVAAGGANFSDAPPWAGGKKRYYDTVYVLVPGEKSWRAAGRLPEPRAYAAVVSVRDGVLVAGGENAEAVFQDTLLLRWDGREVVIDQMPDLPAPCTSPVAALLDGSVYLAGGYDAGSPRASGDNFWRLDLANPRRGWQSLPAWSGPSRAQAVMAAVDGAVYLLSGLEVRPGPDAKLEPVYLRDAHRYRPGKSWEKLPDMPWSAVAAPSPAPVTTTPARVFVLGGVDGRQVGQLPRETRLPDDIITFDVARNEWRLWPERWPDSVVTVPAAKVGSEWIITSGEIKAGVRTTNVWSWQIPEPPVAQVAGA